MRTIEELLDAARAVPKELLPAWLETLTPEEKRLLEIRHECYKSVRR